MILTPKPIQPTYRSLTKASAITLIELISTITSLKAIFAERVDVAFLGAFVGDHPIRTFYQVKVGSTIKSSSSSDISGTPLPDNCVRKIQSYLGTLETLLKLPILQNGISEGIKIILTDLKRKLQTSENILQSSIENDLASITDAFDLVVSARKQDVASAYCMWLLDELLCRDIAQNDTEIANFLKELILNILPQMQILRNMDEALLKGFISLTNLSAGSNVSSSSSPSIVTSQIALLTLPNTHPDTTIYMDLFKAYLRLLEIKGVSSSVSSDIKKKLENLSCLTDSIVTSARLSTGDFSWHTIFNVEVSAKLIELNKNKTLNIDEGIVETANQTALSMLKSLIRDNLGHLSLGVIVSNIASWIKNELSGLAHLQAQPALSSPLPSSAAASSSSSVISPTSDDSDSDLDVAVISSAELGTDCPEIELDMYRNFAILHKIAEEQLEQITPCGMVAQDSLGSASSSSALSVSAPSPSIPSSSTCEIDLEMRNILSFWMSPYVNKLMISLRAYEENNPRASEVKQTIAALHRLLETMQYTTATLLQQPSVENIDVAHKILQSLLLNPLLRKSVSEKKDRTDFLTECKRNEKPVTTIADIRQLKDLMDTLYTDGEDAKHRKETLEKADNSDSDKEHLVFHNTCMKLLRFVLPFLLRKDQVMLPGEQPVSIDNDFATMACMLHSKNIKEKKDKDSKYDQLLAALNRCVIKTVKIIVLNPREKVNENIEKLSNLLSNVYKENGEIRGVDKKLQLPHDDVVYVVKSVLMIILADIDRLRQVLERKNNTSGDNSEISEKAESLAKHLISLYTNYLGNSFCYTHPQLTRVLCDTMITSAELSLFVKRLGMYTVVNHDFPPPLSPPSASSPSSENSSESDVPVNSASSLLPLSSSPTQFSVRRHRTPAPMVFNDLLDNLPSSLETSGNSSSASMVLASSSLSSTLSRSSISTLSTFPSSVSIVQPLDTAISSSSAAPSVSFPTSQSTSSSSLASSSSALSSSEALSTVTPPSIPGSSGRSTPGLTVFGGLSPTNLHADTISLSVSTTDDIPPAPSLLPPTTSGSGTSSSSSSAVNSSVLPAPALKDDGVPPAPTLDSSGIPPAPPLDSGIPPAPVLNDRASSASLSLSAPSSPGAANPLLNAIQGFSKNGLKKTVTSDRSAPVIGEKKGTEAKLSDIQNAVMRRMRATTQSPEDGKNIKTPTGINVDFTC